MVVAARLRVKTARSDGLDSKPSTINPIQFLVALRNPKAEVGAEFHPYGSVRIGISWVGFRQWVQSLRYQTMLYQKLSHAGAVLYPFRNSTTPAGACNVCGLLEHFLGEGGRSGFRFRV